MQSYLFKILMISIFILVTPLTVRGAPGDEETSSAKAPSRPDISLEISLKDGICRNKSPIMVDLIFKNTSVEPQNFCMYKFYDTLINLNIYNARGEQIEFAPKLIQAEKVTNKDWITIPPKRILKRSFSLTRKVVEATGHWLEPGNYHMKATYDGCYKFDPSLPETHIESNLLYFMVTE